MLRWCVTIVVCLVPWMTGCAIFRSNATETKYETIRVNLRHDTSEAIKQNNLALKCLEHGHPEQAEKHFQKALIADVDYGPAHNNLGEWYYSQEKLYLAAWEFEYAIKLMPERPEPHNNLGLVYEDASRFADAMREYQTALSMETAGVEPLANLTRVRIRRGERSSETAQMLHDLVLKDDRPEWCEWAREQLATTHRDLLPCEDGDELLLTPGVLVPHSPVFDVVPGGPDLLPPSAPVPILNGEPNEPVERDFPNETGTTGRSHLRTSQSRIQQANWYDAR